jgi:hypothetical protein
VKANNIYHLQVDVSSIDTNVDPTSTTAAAAAATTE